MLIPRFTRPFAHDFEGGDLTVAGFLTETELGAFPFTISGGTVFETQPIYVQGFNAFAGFLSATGAGTLKFEIGVCHPVTFAVLGYRTLVSGVAVSLAMFLNWGINGQTTPSVNGDIYTVITLRLSAVVGSITLNSAVVWFSAR